MGEETSAIQSEETNDKHSAGSRRRLDMLRGSLWRTIPAFALPVALTGILEQMSSLIDTMMVGHLSGEAGPAAMAAVGSNTPITSLLLNLFIGIALGTNVVIANAIGSGDKDTVHKAVHSSVSLTAFGVVVTIVGELLAAPLLRLLNVPPENLGQALSFLRVYLLGMPSILLYNFEAAIFRSVGITKMPLQALAFSSLVNVALVFLFIPVLNLGVGGAAAATAISYTISAAILFVRLVRIDSPIRLNPRELGIDRQVLGRIVRIGLPAGLQSAVFSLANIVIQACINSLGTEVMAASSAVLSLEYVVYNLLNSFSQACTTFVGQNYGAGQIKRCKKILLIAFAEAEVAELIVLAILLGFGRQIMAAFNPDPTVVELGYLRMCVLFPSYMFSMAYENMSGYLRGFGISLPPALITAISVCGWRFFWVSVVFPAAPSFLRLLAIYPISLGSTTLLVFIALMIIRPSKIYARREKAAA
ncbi:MATE family efflux transporter [uncultured Parolsenella sp.]|mgnify:FL=1|uniref:MATE family efflux transporter n=1 Tax=uncultured Parolsenella sp. TaxID=2083008 RepID=UPI0025E067BE|nr:MATE family efflux transporter [uncultured Parolsenella sp.]